MSIFSKNKPKKALRFRVGKGNAAMNAAFYKTINRAYLDIRIFRGYKMVTRIVTEDTGADCFTVEDVGTFMLPNSEEAQTTLYDRHANYLFYVLDSSKPGEIVDNKEWSTFEFPPISPKEFQIIKEGQTVSDLLAENQKDTGWIIWLLFGVIALVGVMILLGGIN